MIKANLALEAAKSSDRVKPLLILVPLVFFLMAIFFEARATNPAPGVHFYRVSVSPFEPGSVVKKETLETGQETLKIGQREYLVNPQETSDKIFNRKVKRCLDYQLQNWVALSSDSRLAHGISEELSFVGIQIVTGQVMGGHDLNIERLENNEQIALSKIELSKCNLISKADLFQKIRGKF